MRLKSFLLRLHGWLGISAGLRLDLINTFCRDVTATGEAIWFGDCRQDQKRCDSPIPALHGFRSYISVPVVLADGRVFGAESLSVVGASTFPTSGFANPTLTIVAMALRAPRPGAMGVHLGALIAIYALAKLFELGDEAVFHATGGTVSGHSLKHVIAAFAVWPVWHALRQNPRAKGRTAVPFAQ